jgi:hyperosmotically inducible periplasmic protein
MKKILIGVIIGVAIGLGFGWYLTEGQRRKDIRQAQDRIAAEATRAASAVRDAIADIRPEEIKEELARTGVVVRRRAQKIGGAISDSAVNAKITTAIKAKYAVDPKLSALKISVDTTDGLVTLSGVVSSHEEIGRAIKLALETDGVREVVSTLQVRQVK